LPRGSGAGVHRGGPGPDRRGRGGGMIRIGNVLVSPGEGGVYGERMLEGYRVWDPYRSKFAAYYLLGGGLDLTPGMRVLYLGAANGTTVSHVADYVETVYAVEFTPRPMQDLLEVARRRKNIVPIMADANRPDAYASFMEAVDLVYQDVAQPNQVEIAERNLVFLRSEERRVGKECRARWSPEQLQEKRRETRR